MRQSTVIGGYHAYTGGHLLKPHPLNLNSTSTCRESAIYHRGDTTGRISLESSLTVYHTQHSTDTKGRSQSLSVFLSSPPSFCQFFSLPLLPSLSLSFPLEHTYKHQMCCHVLTKQSVSVSVCVCVCVHVVTQTLKQDLLLSQLKFTQ